MDATDLAERRAGAAEEFNRREHRADGIQVVESLSGGLTTLRDLLYARIHDDVQRRVGIDSMLAPISAEKSERITKMEIELYQIVISALMVKQRRYLSAPDDWYGEWLGQFRLGPLRSDGRVAKRLAYYRSKTPDERRLAFSNVLAAALPESRRAPLVLFRLVPLSVQIATAIAFGNAADARVLRTQQVACLPAILDCHECRGKPLDNAEQCRICGNPLWKFEWLTATD